MHRKGIGPQGLGVKGHNGYWVGDASTNSPSSGFGSGMMGMNNNSMMTPYSGGYGGMGMGGMYGMGMGGMGFGGMYGMGMGGMGMGSQWLMSFNQLLFGIQSVVFSLGQAVQIVGMNAQQIRHVYESVRGMVENALVKVDFLLVNYNSYTMPSAYPTVIYKDS